jgi:precorrin-3B synthase
MATGDGLLVRLHLTGGIVPLPMAQTIAECARDFGNGLIDLTSRANLQLRGVSETSLEPLTDRLRAHDLVANDVQAEAVRNVVASPLAGVDPTAVLDISPIVAALEERLASEPALHGLPAKFGFLIDDGGALSLAGIEADVRFEAFRPDEGGQFAIRIAGVDQPIGACKGTALPDAATAIGRAFLALSAGGPLRMSDLVAQIGPARIARAAGFSGADAGRAPRVLGQNCTRGSAGRGQGERAAERVLQPIDRHGHIAIAVAFGRLASADLVYLVETAIYLGARDLRITPWRSIVLTELSPAGLAAAPAMLAREPFILNCRDPRLRVSACVGAPACASATTNTHADAAALASTLTGAASDGTVMHVSGCSKGCGQSRPVPFTLVGNRGRYDLVRGGTARDAPVARGVELTEAAGLLSSELLSAALP